MSTRVRERRDLTKALEAFRAKGNRFVGVLPSQSDMGADGVHYEAIVLTAVLRAFESQRDTSVYYSVRDPRSPIYEGADILVANTTIGCVLVEIKSHRASGIHWKNAKLTVKYGNDEKSVFDQTEKSIRFFLDMFRNKGRELKLPWPPVSSVVAFPRVSRTDFDAPRFTGRQIPYDHLILSDALERKELRDAIQRAAVRATRRTRGRLPTKPAAIELLDRTLGALPEGLRRATKKARKGGLAEEIDRIRESNCLYPDQRNLALRSLEGRPSLVRGVAGSGKSILLAKALVDLLQARLNDPEAEPMRPRILTTCFNRALVPLNRHDAQAFASQAGIDLGAGDVTFSHFEGVLSNLLRDQWGLDVASYTTPDEERLPRVAQQLEALFDGDEALEEDALFDFVFVDEAQDLHPEALRILNRLSRTHPKTGERGIAIFYDDAQNLYGRPRPTWKQLGIHITGGRAIPMNRSRRTSRPIATFAFNVLLGTALEQAQGAGMRGFADVRSLRESDDVFETDDGVVIEFAQRPGRAPKLCVHDDLDAEVDEVVTTVRDLLHCEHLDPEEILIQTDKSWKTLEPFREALEAAAIPCRIPKAREQRDEFVIEEGRVTLSTIHTAKGYDAPVVILVNANGFETDRESRARFYVGATRAQVHLVVTAHGEEAGLLTEMKEMMRRLSRLEPGIA